MSCLRNEHLIIILDMGAQGGKAFEIIVAPIPLYLWVTPKRIKLL